MPTIEQSIEVNVPVRTAYNQWTQFEEFPEFMEGVEYVHQTDDTHLRWKATSPASRRSGKPRSPSRSRPAHRLEGDRREGERRRRHVPPDRRRTTRVMVQMDWEPEGIKEKAGTLSASTTGA